MIKKSSFSKEWIISRRKIYRRNDPSIIEKAIRALSLVEKLKLSEMGNRKNLFYWMYCLKKKTTPKRLSSR